MRGKFPLIEYKDHLNQNSATIITWIYNYLEALGEPLDQTLAPTIHWVQLGFHVESSSLFLTQCHYPTPAKAQTVGMTNGRNKLRGYDISYV